MPCGGSGAPKGKRANSAGQAAVFAEGIAGAAIVDLVKTPGRQIGRPVVEAAVLGPQEAFIEDIEQNISASKAPASRWK
ncbi:hypothetical protein BSNK01_00600 [Bacillaceae bacterium]